jgi:hypothetical protein
MSSNHSITILLQKLGSDHNFEYQRAARDLWSRYATDLLALARRHLSDRVRRRQDEEDVAQSMYKSFVIRQRRGEFELEDRNDLWKLLVTITQNKVANAAKYEQRKKRDVRAEQQEANSDNDAAGPGLLERVQHVAPTPADAAELVEQCDGLLRKLPEPLRELALWKLQGFSNEEIAGPEMMNCAVRTVERKLNLIRAAWVDDAPRMEA